MGRVIYSIGTSKRELEDFLDILKTYQIKAAVDVRTFPVSKRFPQFCQETLSKVLEYSGIKYIYLGFELGGLRRGGYAKHTIKEEYERGINRLEEMAMSTNTVFFVVKSSFLNATGDILQEL
ncbi:MAG: DUF488 domain-containing protein [Deltaproteobacteria bacterium]|nr:DUF488 domain-containing protein [Deltaproteobacteria bacterium]